MDDRYNQFKEELLSSCVPFWLKNAVDTENGGITYFKDVLGLPVEFLIKFAITHLRIFRIVNMVNGSGIFAVTESLPSHLVKGILTKVLSMSCVCLLSVLKLWKNSVLLV